MGLSKTEIYNNALLKVSKKTVDTPDDGTFEANTCNALWDGALRRSLAAHNWSSVIRRVQVDETADSPINIYEHSYQLPNDCVKVVRAYRSTARDDFDFFWVTEGRELLTNETVVYIKYVAEPKTTEFLNDHLTDVIIWNLAMALSYPFTGDDNRERALRQEFEQIVLPRARAGDAMESREIEYEESPGIESLYQSGPIIGRP
jgi:hypothetical protein